jgi:hypothetical protein
MKCWNEEVKPEHVKCSVRVKLCSEGETTYQQGSQEKNKQPAKPQVTPKKIAVTFISV